MTQADNSTSQNASAPSLTRRMIVGAVIGLMAIAFFLIPVQADPGWGKLWMIKPLFMVPFAGAMGGLCNYYITTFHYVAGMNKIVAWIVSAIVFLIGLWMGVVLGLNGTMWN